MDLVSGSDYFARNKQALLAAVAESFGWDMRGPEMNPDPRMWDGMRALLEKPYHSAVEKMQPVLPDPRSGMQRLHTRLYNSRRPNGNPNLHRLTAYDPEYSDLASAMLDQYALCRHWDQQAVELFRGTRDQDAFDRQMYAIEAVRAQVAPYYLHVLKERGLDDTQAVKIIGNVIYSFTDTLDREGQHVTIHPQKGTGFTPTAIVEQVETYARLHESPMTGEDRADGLGVTHGR